MGGVIVVKRVSLAVAVLALVLSGCRGGKDILESDVHSIPVDSVRLGKLEKLVVSVPGSDLSFRLAFEERLVAYLSGSRLKVFQFTKIFPPVKDYSDHEITKKLAELDIPAILVVTLGSDKETQAGAATSGTSVSPVSAWAYPSGSGAFVQGIGVTSRDSTTKILAKREVRATATIYALPTQEKIWIAGLVTKAEEGTARSGGLTSDRYIVESAAEHIAGTLSRDGLRRKKKINWPWTESGNTTSEK